MSIAAPSTPHVNAEDAADAARANTHSAIDLGVAFGNSYLHLPDCFYHPHEPQPLHNPKLRGVNRPLAERLGLSESAIARMGEWIAGHALPLGAQPIALAYAGHQFGQFVPQLGDGRALLLGDIIEGADAQYGQASGVAKRYDLQLKGSGRTIYSRRGDGLAALGPVLREYIISEAMAAMNIPTTRCLGFAVGDEYVQRETPLPRAILLRVAASHLRVGTMEYAAIQTANRRISAVTENSPLRALADYTIARHYPHLHREENSYLALLQRVQQAQIHLICEWMRVGFIHGVMNTDNCSLSGETIDYGPCAFMDAYHAQTVFSSIDSHGRYAFANQPHIAQWNLARLAESMLPLLAADMEDATTIAEAVIAEFPRQFQQQYWAMMGRKLGFATVNADVKSLIESVLQHMQYAGLDYSNSFRQLTSIQRNHISAQA